MKLKITAQGFKIGQWKSEFEISPERKQMTITSLENDVGVKTYYIKPEKNIYDDVIRYVVRVIYKH